jgi:hypothetical protein
MQLALIDLNHPAHYISVGPFSISMGNLIVILSMMAIFTLALFLPFPHSHNGKKAEK